MREPGFDAADRGLDPGSNLPARKPLAHNYQLNAIADMLA
jgi:hypothetical protein